jgi:phosphoribosylanthranilate isomerase
MRMLIKVCGMREADNIQAIDALKPDLLGFIFYPRSARYVGEADISLPTQARKVGVFVQASIEDVLDAVQKFDLAYIQLHGGEDLAYIRELRNRLDARFQDRKTIFIIKAFSIDEHFDFESIRIFEGYCTCFIFDTKGEKHGGNGTKFNWDVLARYKSSTPFLLSGGIRPEDAEAIKEIAPKYPAMRGVDINSGFEISPALKDANAIANFIQELTTEIYPNFIYYRED